MSKNEPLIIQPNTPKITAQTLANIGGTDVSYQPDPALAVVVDPRVLQSQNMLLGLLSAMLNVQHACVRELLETREQIKGLGSEIISLRGENERIAETLRDRDPVAPSTAVDNPVDNPAQAGAGAGVG